MIPSSLRTKTVVFTAVCVLANVLGNFFVALGLKSGGPMSTHWLAQWKVYFSPLVISGVALLILWLTSRMALLSWADLSFVLPVTSVGYVLNALLGRFLLGEMVTPIRWAATLLIVFGSMLVTLTPDRTTGKEHAR